jgi:hypothetical protein
MAESPEWEPTNKQGHPAIRRDLSDMASPIDEDYIRALGPHPERQILPWIAGEGLTSQDSLKLAVYMRIAECERAVFGILSPASRLSALGIYFRLSGVGCFIGFVIWLFKIPPIRLSELFIPSAYADVNGIQIDVKTGMVLVLFVILVFVFLLSLWVVLFKPDSKGRDTADMFVKGLFGVFVGAVATYLGVKAG